jgi:3-isopropylmalate/(R)-2-methylmalate dehydratase small subunit
MEKFEKLTAVAAPMGIPNVDTDAIIPKQFLKTIKRAGLGKALFSERRYNENGEERSDFVLNQGPFRKAKILVAGENFGCGSSREHAPWALLDFGIPGAEITVDLRAQTVTGPDGQVDRFDVAEFSRESLLNGYDEIELSLLKKDRIDAYEKKQSVERPWL